MERHLQRVTLLPDSEAEDEEGGYSPPGGSVRIFRKQDGQWVLEEEIVGDDGEFVGGSVSLSDDGNTVALAGYDGIIKIYGWNDGVNDSTGSWDLEEEILIPIG